MIKIIKPGQREFRGCCDRCGCEFTYEFEDISISGTVECPTCGKHYYHPSKGLTNPGTIGWPAPGETIPCNTYDPCKGCDWYDNMIKGGGTYVGDTPCTWCDKNKVHSTNLGTKFLGTKVDPENLLKWVGVAERSNYMTPCIGISTTQSLNFDDCDSKAISNKSTEVEV
jgi:hypothetical protein